MSVKRIFSLVFFSASIISGVAQAEGFNAEELLAATKLSYDAFAEANPSHVEHFTGYKSWKSGEDARVRIYVSHDDMTMEFNFTCQKHEEGTECHAQ